MKHFMIKITRLAGLELILVSGANVVGTFFGAVCIGEKFKSDQLLKRKG